jgi:hypothetical protein
MATLTTTLTYDVTTVQNYKQFCNGFSSSVLTLGWLASGDACCLSFSGNYGSATITNVSASSGTWTITYSSPTNNFAIGSKVLFTGLTTNTVLNNTYQVITTIPSTTTFTFVFGTSTVSSGADTGTVAAAYNVNTLTNVPDAMFTTGGNNSNNFPSGGTQRFRGAYVSDTPSFTTGATTNNLTLLTMATPHGLDLTRAIGQALNISGATGSFVFLNTNPGGTTTGTNGWPITAITALTITVNTGSSPRADIASSATVGTGTPQWQITTTASSNPDYDTCLYQGDLYGLTTNSGLQNFAGTPGNTPTTATGWRRFSQDMFVSNDTLSSTNKLYFRVLYGANNTAVSGLATPSPSFSFGNGSDGSGNININYSWPIGAGVFSPTGGNAANTGTAQWETNFSGTSGRLSVILWRGFTGTTAQNNAPTTILIIDRSKDNSGNDTDAYWNIAYSGFQSSTVGWSYQQSILKPGTGGAGIADFSQTTAIGAIHTLQVLNSQSYNNQIPVMPIFPVIGYVGNPLLGGIAMKSGDTSEGALVQVSLYGTTHPFLMTARGGANHFGANGNCAAGIRWE